MLRFEDGEVELTIDCKMTPNAHAAPTAKSPEPAVHLPQFLLVVHEPALRPELFRVGEYVSILMHAYTRSPYHRSAWNHKPVDHRSCGGRNSIEVGWRGGIAT